MIELEMLGYPITCRCNKTHTVTFLYPWVVGVETKKGTCAYKLNISIVKVL